MTTLDFQAATGYRGTVNGRRYHVTAGDVLAVDLADLAALLRDVPGLVDPAHPLTAEQADTIRQRQRQALVDAAEHERAEADAIRDWVTRWDTEGPLCPGLHPAERHPMEARDLRAARVPDGWVIACETHLPMLVEAGEIPWAPEPVDRTVRVYRCVRRYYARWVEYAPRGAFGGPASPVLLLDLEPGQRYPIRADIAAWIERDSPGAIEIEET